MPKVRPQGRTRGGFGREKVRKIKLTALPAPHTFRTLIRISEALSYASRRLFCGQFLLLIGSSSQEASLERPGHLPGTPPPCRWNIYLKPQLSEVTNPFLFWQETSREIHTDIILVCVSVLVCGSMDALSTFFILSFCIRIFRWLSPCGNVGLVEIWIFLSLNMF